jgi:nucleotide-binding universal stress UspA family protein
MDLKRILVAINTPNGRDAAVERALALARSSRAELYLLQAVPPTRSFASGAAERLDRMEGLRQRAEDAGVRVQTVEQQGDPAATIELHANARAVDLIVMGGEPRRGWGRRSSVAEQVIRRTSVPTLVVASDAPASSFRNVLVALDLSPASKDILGDAVGLTANEAVQLTVMHTVKAIEAAEAVQSPARWAVPEYRTHMLDKARRSLDALLATLPAGDRDIRVQLSTGSVPRTILDRAADVNADLIVVGRSRGFKLLGSTALRVLRKNNRALLVIPAKAQPTRRVEEQTAA